MVESGQFAGGPYDYVVVGAGTAGCVVAARLSEDPAVRVLLLEAGGSDDSFWLKIPVGYGRTIADKRVNWCYETEPNEALDNRRVFWPRGKVLGGSGSINGLMYVRGQAADYDLWRDQGNPGWGYEDVLPYFRMSEDQENGADRWHGVGGPVTVSNLTERNPLCDALIASAGAVGIPPNPDFNGERQAGAGYYQASIRRGARVSGATAYLRPARQRRNLTVVTEAFAEKLVLDGKRVTGVQFRRGGQRFVVRAAREVILSGGTINSPQLLMLSGIGPQQHLRELGIPVVIDAAGVGQNLQDHFGGQITWKCRQPITMNDIMLSNRRKMMAGLRWLLFRNGPLSIPAGQAGLFTQVLEESGRPDVQFLFQSFSGGYYKDGLFKFSGFANFICALRPRSRGHIALRSADPGDHPLMKPNYFSDPYDRAVVRAGFKLARRIANAKPLADFISAEHLPGSDVQTDDEIDAYFREQGGCVSHQVGTCKMGSDPLAVVDQQLRVRGIDGLRVADASIMPTEISGNTNAACFMIGERAAAFIKEAARAGLLAPRQAESIAS